MTEHTARASQAAAPGFPAQCPPPRVPSELCKSWNNYFLAPRSDTSLELWDHRWWGRLGFRRHIRSEHAFSQEKWVPSWPLVVPLRRHGEQLGSQLPDHPTPWSLPGTRSKQLFCFFKQSEWNWVGGGVGNTLHLHIFLIKFWEMEWLNFINKQGH